MHESLKKKKVATGSRRSIEVSEETLERHHRDFSELFELRHGDLDTLLKGCVRTLYFCLTLYFQKVRTLYFCLTLYI